MLNVFSIKTVRKSFSHLLCVLSECVQCVHWVEAQTIKVLNQLIFNAVLRVGENSKRYPCLYAHYGYCTEFQEGAYAYQRVNYQA